MPYCTSHVTLIHQDGAALAVLNKPKIKPPSGSIPLEILVYTYIYHPFTIILASFVPHC